MLFTYKFLEGHDIYKMQSYIDYIFNDVWCVAPDNEYGIELFENNGELKEIMEQCWKEELAGKHVKSTKFFLTGLNEIFNEFKQLTAEEIEQLSRWYQSNNDVESCCNNEPAIDTVRYADIKKEFPDLLKKFKSFYTKLYSHDFLGYSVIKKHIGTLSDHYQQFVTVNDEDICPFCGLSSLDGRWSKTREAYDHYLPKSKYPFNSINFRNLVPACYDCNSKYKRIKDPIRFRNRPRKSFYPFSEPHQKLLIDVALAPVDWNNYEPSEINLTIGPVALKDEITTWLDVYQIDSRYKNFMCGKNYGKSWITTVSSALSRGRTLEDIFQELKVNEENSPFCDFNFIKRPFLEACKNSNLFE